jgi:hypothetical protein
MDKPEDKIDSVPINDKRDEKSSDKKGDNGNGGDLTAHIHSEFWDTVYRQGIDPYFGMGIVRSNGQVAVFGPKMSELTMYDDRKTRQEMFNILIDALCLLKYLKVESPRPKIYKASSMPRVS